MKMRFCDLPKGAKFKYPDGKDIEVEIVDSDLTVEKLKAHIRKLLEMGEFYAGAIESDRDFRENYDFEDWEEDAKELLK